MYASVQKHDLPASWFFRFFGRAGSVVVLAIWLVMVIADFFRIGAPVLENYYQAALLGVVFVGYFAGWHNEVLGGALAIAGTIGFVALYLVMFGVYPAAGVEWLAAPGVFYLIAHYLDKPCIQSESSQP
jgi:hypothetical protein